MTGALIRGKFGYRQREAHMKRHRKKWPRGSLGERPGMDPSLMALRRNQHCSHLDL